MTQLETQKKNIQVCVGSSGIKSSLNQNEQFTEKELKETRSYSCELIKDQGSEQLQVIKE
jgi:hypothetical protein